MLFRSLADMTDAAYYAAGAKAFTSAHPVAHVQDLVNQGLAAFRRICRTTNPRFDPIKPTTIITDGENTAYVLPADFRALVSVEYLHDTLKSWLTPLNLNERARLTDPIIASQALCARGYWLNDSTIELLPKPQAGDTVTVWYAADVPQLVSDNDRANVMDRLDCYPVWWAAREIANEREAWERYDRLTTRLQDLEAEIRILARSLDTNAETPLVDERVANPVDRYGRRLRSRGWP